MFAVDNDDEDEEEVEQPASGSGLTELLKPTVDIDLNKKFDRLKEDLRDAKGYFKVLIREVFEKRYELLQRLGTGSYSGVARAYDHVDGKYVAIKIIRKDTEMESMAVQEANFVKELNEADPNDTRNIIRFERSFYHHTHLCLVYENMDRSLRDVLLENLDGVSLPAVWAYAIMSLKAARTLKECGLLHCDLKPDNILIDTAGTRMKVADLGSAFKEDTMKAGQPTLASRFYRAPEIMLGLKGSYAMDMWSIGCTLYELATGKYPFDGNTNNEMLHQIQTMRGKVPRAMLQDGLNQSIKNQAFNQQVPRHFHVRADKFVFKQLLNQDENADIFMKEIEFPFNPAKELSLRTKIMEGAGSKGDVHRERKVKEALADLLEKMLLVDARKRIDPVTAMMHPFIQKFKELQE